MLIKAKFDIDADILYCPEDICDKIEEHQTEFWKWLFDKNVDHKYWHYENGEKFGCCYRAEAFVEWLNQFVLIDNPQKAKVVESHVRRDAECDRIIYF